MQIRRKSWLMLSTILVGYLALCLLVGVFFFYPSLRTIQETECREDVSHASAWIAQQQRSLATFAFDWAAWDATYDAMAEPSAESFARKELSDEVLVNANVHFLLLLDPEGRVAWSTVRAPGTYAAMRLPELDDRAWDSSNALLRESTRKDVAVGVDAFGRWPAVVAASQIRDTHLREPPRGYLVAGRFIDSRLLSEFTLQQACHIEMVPLTTPSTERDYRNVLDELEDGDPLITWASLASVPVSWMRLEAASGEPAVLVRLEGSHDVAALAQSTLWVAFWGGLVAGVFIIIAMHAFLSRAVMRRIDSLRGLAVAICEQGDLSRRIKIQGNDEIALLARDFNGMLDRIQQDRTRMLELQDCLQRLYERAESASRAKSEFLANMSHEIRTPMTAILGFAEILESSSDEEEKRDAVDTIRRNGAHLMQVLNDILDLTKVEAGKLSIERRPFNLPNLLRELRSIMAIKAQTNQIQYRILCDGPIPVSIQSDPVRLKQILLNLLSNAFKFTEYGSIDVHARVLRDGDAPMLEFSVEDTGVGMTEEQMGMVFKPFTQGDASTTRQFGGSGLGLAICDRLVKLLGGELGVTSELGRGSRFYFTIDPGNISNVETVTRIGVKSRRSGDDSRNPTPGRQPALGGLDVLVVEDGLDNQRLIEFLLKKRGAAVTVAPNGQIACRRVSESIDAGRPYDLILMDMQMPVMDGYSATPAIRALGFDRPIIALTAHTMTGDREKCLDIGCDDFIGKPIDPKEFTEVLKKAVEAPDEDETLDSDTADAAR